MRIRVTNISCALLVAALSASCGRGNGSVSPSAPLPPSALAPLRPGGEAPASRHVRGNLISESVIHSFGGAGDGANPEADLMEDANGILYGTTNSGGAGGGSFGYGTVFKISQTGVESVLHSFGAGYDGVNPEAGLTEDGTGVLYGTTAYGGAGNHGTFFRITRSGVERVLHSFTTGSLDGGFPQADLIVAGAAFYIATSEGGTDELGTVLRITPSGGVHLLHSFVGGGDGVNPEAALTNIEGVFYGTTYIGGANGVGTVFKVTRSGVESVLHTFGSGTDGAFVEAGLTYVDGALYGATWGGGASNNGTVFEITRTGVERVLYSFAGGSDGAHPLASMIDVNDVLYGTTYQGGAHGAGTVFKITRSGVERVLHSFAGGSDGADPLSALTNVNGVLYGTTYEGGAYNAGTVFTITGF